MSAQLLALLAQCLPSITFAVNYPGIGNGQLNRLDVERVLEESGIPDNVEIWEYDK